MSEQRNSIIISTGMDNLNLLEKLQQSETLTGASLNRIKSLYTKFNDEKLAIEDRANRESWARYQANLEKKAAADAVFFRNQAARYEEQAAIANIGQGSIPANMQGGRGRRGAAGGGMGSIIGAQVAADASSGDVHQVISGLELGGQIGLGGYLGHRIGMHVHRALGYAFRTAAGMLGSIGAAVPILGTAVAGLMGNLYMRGQLHDMAGHYGTDAATAETGALLANRLTDEINKMQAAGRLAPDQANSLRSQLAGGSLSNITRVQAALRPLLPHGFTTAHDMAEANRLDAAHMDKYLAAQRENWTLQQRLNADLNTQHVIKMEMAKLDKDSLEYKKLQLELDDAILAGEKDSKALAAQRASLTEQYQRNQRTVRKEMNAEAGSDLMGIPTLESSAGRDYAEMLKNQYGEWNSGPVQRMAQAYLRQQYGIGYDFERFSLATGGDYSAWLKTPQGAGEHRYLKQLAGPLEALGIVKDSDLAGRLDELTRVNQNILEKLSHIGIEE